MLRSFSAHNYRGFESVEVSDFASVNLFTGLNDVGKSNLLEGILIASSAGQLPQLTLNLLAGRGYPPAAQWGTFARTSVWDPYFRNRDTTIPISFTCRFDDLTLDTTMAISSEPMVAQPINIETGNLVSESTQVAIPFRLALQPLTGQAMGNQSLRSLLLSIGIDGTEGQYIAQLSPQGSLSIAPQPPQSPVKTTLIGTSQATNAANVSALFANLQKSNREELLVRTLRVIDPLIERVEVVVEGPISVPWVRMKDDSFIPLPLLGDGASRVATIALTMIDASPGVVLVDEIDTGIHYSALQSVWEMLTLIAQEYEVQLFAATHSRECVVAAREALAQTDDLRLFRLEREVSRDVRVFAYSSDQLDAAIDLNVDVR